MINGKRIIAIIPARGGSKGLPGKNIKILCGKPLIAWSIEAGLASKYIDEVMVTTDSEEIAEILFKQHGKSLDPLTLKFTQLHAIVTELPEFADDPEKSNEKKLENIQMHWYEIFMDE